MASRNQTQVHVVEISSSMYNVKDLSYFFSDVWYVFIGEVFTSAEVLEPRKGQPKPKEPKTRTTTSVTSLIDGPSIRMVRRYFNVRKLHVFVPYRDAGFTNTMFIPMHSLSLYVKEQVFLTKEAEKNENDEIAALSEDFAASLRSKLQVMVHNGFFEDRQFDISVIIQPRKNYTVFAFINFFNVSEYDMGLASEVLRQKTWENAAPGTYVETRFSKAKPQDSKHKR